MSPPRQGPPASYSEESHPLKNVVGEPVDPVTGTARLFIPLSFQDILETMEEHGVAKGAAISILQIFGMGVQTYEGRR